MDIIETVIGVILLFILYIPGIIYFVYPGNKLWNKIFTKINRNKKNQMCEETETVEEKVRRELSTISNIKNGASWFYWIAGFSVINTLLIIFDGNLNFVVGLGLTQLVDEFSYTFSDYFGMIANMCGIGINILIALVFVYLGIMANKGKRWSFIIGMILYALDAIIFIIFKDFLGVAFHIFALIGIFGGFKALHKSNELSVE